MCDIPFVVKIVIRGERNTGKTNLFRRMEGKQFNEAYTPTTAINVMLSDDVPTCVFYVAFVCACTGHEYPMELQRSALSCC